MQRYKNHGRKLKDSRILSNGEVMWQRGTVIWGKQSLKKGKDDEEGNANDSKENEAAKNGV